VGEAGRRLFRTDHRRSSSGGSRAPAPKLLCTRRAGRRFGLHHHYLVAQFARKDVTVILSGVGATSCSAATVGTSAGTTTATIGSGPWLRRNVLHPLFRALPSDRHSKVMNLFRYLRTYVESHEHSFDERYRAYVQVFARTWCRRLLRDGGSVQLDARTSR